MKDDLSGVREYICLHFGSEEARTTMGELEEWSMRGQEPQPCYINILRRLFPDIKPKVLQLLLVACDSDLIKTVETILPCCTKLKNNGQITYIKATLPPQKMMLLSRTKFPTRYFNEKQNVHRYSPYSFADRTRYPPMPAGLFMPPYAPGTPPDNCGLCLPSYLPPYYIPRPRISRDHGSKASFGAYTTPKYTYPVYKSQTTSTITADKEELRTSAAATLISLSDPSSS